MLIYKTRRLVSVIKRFEAMGQVVLKQVHLRNRYNFKIINVLKPNIVICPSRFLTHKSPQGVHSVSSRERLALARAHADDCSRGGPVSSVKDISAALEESAGGS